MKKILLLLSLITFCLSGLISHQASAADTGVVFGQGALPCKKFLKSSKRKKNDYVIWIQGYLTAYNAIAPDITNVLSGKDFKWVLEQVEQICQAMPDDYFNEAMVQLVFELHPQGIKIAPPSSEGKKP